jgi:hypothetical protein
MRERCIAVPGVASAPVIAIGIYFRDRGYNRAKATCYCAVGISQAQAWTLALAIAARMSEVSDATMTKVDLVWRYSVDSAGTPAESSDISRKILMLVVNPDDEINGLIIPSPQAAIWEAIGPYAGIRLDLLSAGAVGFSGMLLAVDFRTEDGRIFGSDLQAGGLAI